MSLGIQNTPDSESVRGEKHDVLHSEKVTTSDLMGDAFDGENREHEMGVWEAAKSHPWACLWAFVMCFTIVRCCSSLHAGLTGIHTAYHREIYDIE